MGCVNQKLAYTKTKLYRKFDSNISVINPKLVCTKSDSNISVINPKLVCTKSDSNISVINSNISVINSKLVCTKSDSNISVINPKLVCTKSDSNISVINSKLVCTKSDSNISVINPKPSPISLLRVIVNPVFSPTSCLNIGLIDDDKITIRIYEKILNRISSGIIHTSTKHNDLLCCLNTLDVIFIDYDLGYTYGDKVAIEYKKHGYIGKIVLLSGSVDVFDDMEKTALFNDIIEKPGTIGNLSECLSKINYK